MFVQFCYTVSGLLWVQVQVHGPKPFSLMICISLSGVLFTE